MAIKTNDTPTAVEVVAEQEPTINLTKVEETRESFSLETAKQKYELEVRQSGVIDTLTSKIDLSNTTSIVEFGKEPAQKMAAVADQVLSKYNPTSIDETTKLVDALLAVMKKIDIDEIKSLAELAEEHRKKSLFDRFKESAQKKLERLIGKYKSLGTEMEQICSQLAVYEQQIKDSNNDIARMYESAKEEYKSLVEVILAGEQAITEIEAYKNQLEAEVEQTGDSDKSFELQNVTQALTLMEQRVADLRGSEAVALQSIPIFKIQEYTNANLARKVNSAFIVTVPAFKTALVNSVIAKQQSLQAQGLSALDEATSALVRKNADNAVQQLQLSQKLANSSAIKADDIEYSWNTIMNGIQQYKEMEKQYSQIRKEESRRIEDANKKYIEQLQTGKVI